MDTNRRHADTGGDMLRPAVVADKQRGRAQQPRQIGQAGLADQ
jgi:hypothetical protein